MKAVQGNILESRCDAMFVSHNHKYLFGDRGLQPTLLKTLRDGDKIKTQLQKYGSYGREPGELVETGAGGLLVRHLLHVVTIPQSGKATRDDIRNSILAALNYANFIKCRSISVPNVFAANYSDLNQVTIEGLIRTTCEEWAAENPAALLREIVLVKFG